MKTQKIIVFFFAFLFLTGVFVSCSRKPSDTPDTTTSGNGGENTGYKPDVPDGITFNGATFSVMSIDPNLYASMRLDFDFDKSPDEYVDEAVYRRNRVIERDYNVAFKTTYLDIAETSQTLNDTVMSNDDVYQLMMLISREAFPAALERKTLLPEELPYINTEAPWYMHSVNESFSLNGMQILAYTDESLNTYLQSVCVFFNADLIDDLQLEDPYALLMNGNWTKEAFYRYATAAIRDVNGDGAFDVMDGDVFGVISENDHFYPSLWIGAGIRTIGKNKSGEPEYQADGNEKLIGILEELTGYVKKDGFYSKTDTQFASIADVGDNRRDAATEYFTHGGGLFRFGVIGYIQLLNNMEANFGVLPLPKYDEEQKDYHSRTEDGWLHVVPITVRNTTMVGVIIEALGAESKNYVIPAFFDIALDNRYVRDEGKETTEYALNIIFNNAINDLGDTIWLNYVRGQLCMVIDKGTSAFSSKLSSLKSQVNKAVIEKTRDDLEKLKEEINN